MSEMNSRESYTRYDEMTTDQLREILRKHAHGELEKEPDTEELFYIMEVLANRESENPEKQIKSTEEAYAFKEETSKELILLASAEIISFFIFS